LPTHHPRSHRSSPSSPTPTRSDPSKRRTCWPTSPRSVTRDGPAAAAPSLRPPPPRTGAPARPSGRRHPLVAILAMAAAAVLTGARSMTAIAEWAQDAPQPVRAALGARRDAPGPLSVPSEATIRRTLARLDADALAGGTG